MISCGGSCVMVNGEAKNINITSNTFKDVYSNTSTASAIYIDRSGISRSERLNVSSNALFLGDLVASYKNKYGLFTTNTDDGGLSLGNNDFGLADTLDYRITQSHFEQNSIPTINSGSVIFSLSSGDNTTEQIVTLTNSFAGNTTYTALASIDSGIVAFTPFYVKCTKISNTSISLKISTFSGAAFGASGSIKINWMAFGV